MKIVITDDDKFVSMSLKTILESTGDITVLATGSSGEEAIALYDEHKPDIMLMDIRMDGMTGLEAGERILQKDKAARILYLTTFSDDEYIVKALTIGAKGYILKQDFEGIAPALEAVMNGQSVFGDSVVSRLVVQSAHEFD
ncbi:MAG: response regulator transcription factor, partial [Oscillospiraceae bacterium]|nr:response regulator transcription factor [Oscillospiraceae bacterium]